MPRSTSRRSGKRNKKNNAASNAGRGHRRISGVSSQPVPPECVNFLDSAIYEAGDVSESGGGEVKWRKRQANGKVITHTRQIRKRRIRSRKPYAVRHVEAEAAQRDRDDRRHQVQRHEALGDKAVEESNERLSKVR